MSDGERGRRAPNSGDGSRPRKGEIRQLERRDAARDYVNDGGRVDDLGDGSYLVEGSTGNEYVVHPEPGCADCTCKAWKTGFLDCKHILKVRKRIEDGGPFGQPAGPLRLPAKRPTYPQDWPAYNAARDAMNGLIPFIIKAACIALTAPSPRKSEIAHRKVGRPALPVEDSVMCVCSTRVLRTQSGVLASSDVRAMFDRGLLFGPRPPSANAISAAMRRHRLAPVLDGLIDLLATPFRTFETCFAADRTTFAAPHSRYMIVVDKGKQALRRVARVAHLDCVVGVKTGIVTAASVNDEQTGESQFLVPNLRRTNRRFRIDEVLADAGYGSEANREFVVRVLGAAYYCQFKRNQKLRGDGGVWDEQLSEFETRPTEWARRYHRRSKIEASFSSDKRLHRRRVLSRTLQAQRSEILAHCVVHNARVLIRQFFLRRIDIAFLDEFTRRRLEELRARIRMRRGIA